MTQLAVNIRLARARFDLAFDLNLSMQGINAIFGPSGSGKTTLLRCLAGLETQAVGTIRYDQAWWQNTDRNVHLPTHRRGIGMVFQEPGLFDHLTVRGNLEYGRKRAPAAGPAIDYDHVISMLALEHLLESRPRQLSLGEQQRVAIGRSLLNKPCVLLMDEPLASLDGRRKLEIIPFLRKLPRVFNVPVIYVSHSVPEIYQLADQLIVLDQGSVVAHGPVHETCTRLEFIRQLDDHVGVVLDASVADHEAEYGLTRLTVGRQQLLVPYRDLPPGEPLRVFIAATNISLALAPPSTAISVLNILEATVRRIDEQHDASHNVYVTLDVGAPLLARITRKSLHNLDLKPGQTVYAYIKAVSLEEHL